MLPEAKNGCADGGGHSGVEKEVASVALPSLPAPPCSLREVSRRAAPLSVSDDVDSDKNCEVSTIKFPEAKKSQKVAALNSIPNTSEGVSLLSPSSLSPPHSATLLNSDAVAEAAGAPPIPKPPPHPKDPPPAILRSGDDGNGRPQTPEGGDGGPVVCFLCRRKFPTASLLKKHERKSTLHKANLLKRDQRRRSEEEEQANTKNIDQRGMQHVRVEGRQETEQVTQNGKTENKEDAAKGGKKESTKCNLVNDAEVCEEDSQSLSRASDSLPPPPGQSSGEQTSGEKPSSRRASTEFDLGSPSLHLPPAVASATDPSEDVISFAKDAVNFVVSSQGKDDPLALAEVIATSNPEKDLGTDQKQESKPKVLIKPKEEPKFASSSTTSCHPGGLCVVIDEEAASDRLSTFSPSSSPSHNIVDTPEAAALGDHMEKKQKCQKKQRKISSSGPIRVWKCSRCLCQYFDEYDEALEHEQNCDGEVGEEYFTEVGGRKELVGVAPTRPPRRAAADCVIGLDQTKYILIERKEIVGKKPKRTGKVWDHLRAMVNDLGAQAKQIVFEKADQDKSFGENILGIGIGDGGSGYHRPFITCFSDVERYSNYSALILASIELFEVSPEDPVLCSGTLSGSPARGILPQHVARMRRPPAFVGVRCLHCKGLPPGQRHRTSTVFPGSVRTLASNVYKIACTHFAECACLPPGFMEVFSASKLGVSGHGGSVKVYIQKNVLRLGVESIYQEGTKGLVFKRSAQWLRKMSPEVRDKDSVTAFGEKRNRVNCDETSSKKDLETALEPPQKRMTRSTDHASYDVSYFSDVEGASEDVSLVNDTIVPNKGASPSDEQILGVTNGTRKKRARRSGIGCGVRKDTRRRDQQRREAMRRESEEVDNIKADGAGASEDRTCPTPETEKEKWDFTKIEYDNIPDENFVIGAGPDGSEGYEFSLAVPGDDESNLSELHCHIRSHCVEAYVVTQGDVDKERNGRNHAPVGQVGIRCVFCSPLSLPQGATAAAGAVSFPSSTNSIYDAVTRIIVRHHDACEFAPLGMKATIARLKLRLPMRRSHMPRHYFHESARKLGIVNTPGGIRLDRFRHEAWLEELDRIRLEKLSDNDKSLKEEEGAEKAAGGKVGEDMAKAGYDHLPAPLGVPSDGKKMTPLHKLARSFLEVFAVLDTEEADWYSRMSRTGIDVGQVGFRCVHCYDASTGKGKFKFPSSVDDIYVQVRHYIYDHFDNCPAMPRHLKDAYKEVRYNRALKPDVKQKYKRAALDMGLYDLPHKGVSHVSVTIEPSENEDDSENDELYENVAQPVRIIPEDLWQGPPCAKPLLSQLILPNEQGMTTMFKQTMYENLRITHFSGGDLRVNVDTGTPGLTCAHCQEKSYFANSYRVWINSTMPKFLNHLMECEIMDEAIKARLAMLRKRDDTRKLPPSMNKALHLRLWARISQCHQTFVENESTSKDTEQEKSYVQDTDPNSEFKRSSCSLAKYINTEDHQLATDYKILLYEQVNVCYLTEADRRIGNRGTIPMGFPGVYCRHCRLKHFFTPVFTVWKDTTLPKLYNHLIECPQMPNKVKHQLEQLKQEAVASQRELPREANKVLHVHLWDQVLRAAVDEGGLSPEVIKEVLPDGQENHVEEEKITSIFDADA